MNFKGILFLIATLLTYIFPILAQTTDEIVHFIEADELSESAYQRLLEAQANLEMDHRHNLVIRYDQCLNTREGYRHRTPTRLNNNKAYLGDPLHQTIRYHYQQTDHRQHSWKAGLVLDKDAGERWSYRPPFSDSYSLYASYENPTGRLRQLLLGHYRLKLGSGLLCNQQFSLGKNLSSAGFFQQGRTLSPHSSASEDNYMQGIAFQYRLNKKIAIVPFLSVRKIDGSLSHDTLSSWSTNGYHRTQSEADQQQSTWLTQTGLSARWLAEWYALSAQVFYSHLNHLYYRPIRTYNRNTFRGHQLLQASVDYEARWGNTHLKGETALDDQQGWATVNALRQTLFDNWSLTLQYRQYSNRYRQLSGSSVSESSAMQGERGEQLCIEGPIGRHWNLQCRADFFQFTQAQYGIYQPSQGYELATQVSYESRHAYQQPAPLALTFRYRLKAKYKNNTQTDAPTDLTPYYRHALQATAQVNTAIGLTSQTQLHSRLYSAQHTGGIENGWTLSQALGWKNAHTPLQASLQGTWFQTDSYDTRIYLAEKNILYGFGLPMLYGTGFRYSFTLVYPLLKHWHIDAKYARTNYKHKNSIGSGLQQILGNHQDNLYIQVRAKF